MYNLATVFAKRGQKDSAFYWLDQFVTTAGYSNDKAVSADEDFASLRSDPRFDPLLERMRAVLRPCLTRTESRRFDFWVGEWDVKNAQGQPAGQSSVQRLLEGCALYENWVDLQGGGGKSLNSYNTTEAVAAVLDGSVWARHGVSRERVDQREPSLYCEADMPQGPALLHMTFTPVKPDVVRQFGECRWTAARRGRRRSTSTTIARK